MRKPKPPQTDEEKAIIEGLKATRPKHGDFWPSPNWTLLIGGVGSYPVEICEGIADQFRQLGQDIRIASLLLDNGIVHKL